MSKINVKFSKVTCALSLGLGAALLLSACVPAAQGHAHAKTKSGKSAQSSKLKIKSVEFSSMPSPKTEAQMLDTYSTSVAQVTYSDGSSKKFPLSYNILFKNTDMIAKVGGKKYAAAQIYDHKMKPILDPKGEPVIAETADSNSLINLGGGKLAWVNHWEYDDVLADGAKAYKVENWYRRMPMTMSLSQVAQAADGKLSVKSQQPVDFSPVHGGWIFCNGSLTPWNTHLGGEEDYDLFYVPGEKKYSSTKAGIKALNEVYFKGTKEANPYHYGYATEVAPKADGSYNVDKFYNMGRGTWELAKFAADGRTAFFGDDGSYSGLFMFVGNKKNDPRAGGNIYAAKWNQTSDKDGGTANVQWVNLGGGTYAEAKALIDKGITINDIFEYSREPKEGFKPTRAGSSETIYLKLKKGMEQAAAFFETRRYAAYLGATTEFTKGEGVAINDRDKKMYYAMSAIKGSMKAEEDSPVDDVKLPENSAGATYTFDLASGQKDTAGNVINSAYVPNKAYVEPALLGRPMKADANGNTAEVDSIANTDNVSYSEAMRTLFIGEDSGKHVNNYVWAYNVDTKKLSRILSVAAGGEATGLSIVEGLNGHAYILSNNQHQGDWIRSQNKDLTAKLTAAAKAKWGVNKHGTLNYRLTANVGYIGGLPSVK